jgi:hypothetical protein
MTRPLLTADEYTRIVADGRAAEVLARYVKRPAGRPPADDPVTGADRQRAYRERQAATKNTARKSGKSTGRGR